jgi:hypothetical protein
MPEEQPEEKVTKVLSFRVPITLWERVIIAATKLRISMQAFVIRACERYLSELEGTEVPEKPDASAPSTEKVLESFLTKPKQQK